MTGDGPTDYEQWMIARRKRWRLVKTVVGAVLGAAIGWMLVTMTDSGLRGVRRGGAMNWIIGSLLVLFSAGGGGLGWWKGTRDLASPPYRCDRPVGVGAPC